MLKGHLKKSISVFIDCQIKCINHTNILLDMMKRVILSYFTLNCVNMEKYDFTTINLTIAL